MSTANDLAAPTTTATQELAKKEWGEFRPPVRDTDFKEKYPPDRELGHELDDTARVWKVFRDEAIEHDDALLKTWNETVNILLTFAGLFSAAVTSFVVASTEDLKPDQNAYVANLLYSLGNANAATAFAHVPAPPPLETAPTSLARIVNGLWFTSLFLALAAALLCILVKQWLDEYTARTRGSAKNPHEWAQRRSFYFQGLTDWNVAAIISFLPVFLHLALFLFLVGLTVFLWDLDNGIRWVMLVLVTLLLVFYAVSLFIPVWHAPCPYATPLLAQLRNLRYTTLVGVCILRNWAPVGRAMVRRLIRRMFNRIYAAFLPTSLRNADSDPSLSESDAPTPDPQTRLLLEQRARRPFERVLHRITKTEEDMPYRERGDLAARLDCSSLRWLMHDVSGSDAVAVAWQSLGALLEERESLRFNHMVTALPGLVDEVGGNKALWRTLRMDGVLDDMHLARITRSALFLASFLGPRMTNMLFWDAPYSDRACIENTLSPDAALICADSLGHYNIVRVLRRLHEETHRPLPSTAMFLANQLVPDPDYSVHVAAIGLLHHCDLSTLPATFCTHVTRVLGHSCKAKEAKPSHKCNAYCVVNALCACALRLIEIELSGTLSPPENSAGPFDVYSHVRLVVRILSATPGFHREDTPLPATVWTTLTDVHYFSGDIRRVDRIHAVNWAEALQSPFGKMPRPRRARLRPQPDGGRLRPRTRLVCGSGAATVTERPRDRDRSQT